MPETLTCVVEIIQNGQWLSPLAILVSACIGAGVALNAIKTNREIAKKRATLDVILKSESDEYFERIFSVFLSEKQRKAGLATLVNPETDAEKRSQTEVDNFLNHYELIAISIKKEILDEDFYKQWMRSSYIRHFHEAKDYIEGIRITSPNAFTEFEDMVNKWEEESKDK